LKLNTIQNI